MNVAANRLYCSHHNLESQMSEEPTEVRFLLSAERDRHGMGGLEIIALPVHITEANKIRNTSADRHGPHPLADFQVRALADAEATFGDTYGWSREYHEVFSVDTERAAVMLKRLRALDRGMEKLERELGYASNFPSYLARVASVLKIRQFGWRVAEGGQRWTYDGNRYAWGDATRMTDWVTRQLAEYRKVEHA
jgi:hypothetical protein